MAGVQGELKLEADEAQGAAGELPSGWVRVTIEDVSIVNPPGKTVSPPDDTLVSFLPMPAVEELSGRVDPSDHRPFRDVRKGFTRFREGDLLFAKITPSMENGKVAVARGLLNGLGCGTTEFHVLRPTEAVIVDYLRYFVLRDCYRGEAKRHMSGAVGQQRVPKSFLAESSFPLPPLAEQRRIVDRIDELFSRIEAGERAVEAARAGLKRYRKAVLKAAVTGAITEDWRDAHKVNESGEALLARILKERRAAWETAEIAKHKAKGKPLTDKQKQALLARYKPPAEPDPDGLPDLPEGWVWATLPQLGEFGRGKSKHRPRNDPKLYDGVYPFLQTGDVRQSNGRIRSYSQTYNEAGLAQSRLWPAGTVCITIAANIAETGILQFDACFPDSVVGLIAHPDIGPEYPEFFLRTARDDLDRYAPATAQKNINLAILETVCVPLPPTAEQSEIVSRVEEALSRADAAEATLEAQTRAARALKQSILKAAFTGRLVPQNPNDEPASELLKRVKKNGAD